MEGCKISSKETSEKKQTPCKFVDWVKYVLPRGSRRTEGPFVGMTHASKEVLQLTEVSRTSTGKVSLAFWNPSELALRAAPSVTYTSLSGLMEFS